jgi:hypothetical protein
MTAKQHISRFAAISYSPNRLAGPQSRRIQNLRGAGRFGAASKGRRLSDQERRAVENELKTSGRI